MAGTSLSLGRYHIQSDNIDNLDLGRNIAKEVWRIYKKYWRINYFLNAILE
tara:strand:+ start:141 stop:293 length:153 start_codon:yes stop_codon:yes gene_type:complete